jgi:hypothetical protein
MSRCHTEALQLESGHPSDGEVVLIFAGGSCVGRLTFSAVPDWREPDETIRSEVEVIRGWLETCDGGHPACRAIEEELGYVPSRLVDSASTLTLQIGEGHQPSRYSMRAAADFRSSGEASIRYAALSYCWGKSMPESVKTMTTNLADRQENGFAVDDLPRTLRDACSVAHAPLASGVSLNPRPASDNQICLVREVVDLDLGVIIQRSHEILLCR